MRPTLLLTFALGLSGLASAREATTVRLGFFPNVTHAAALAGLERGFFQKELGKVKGQVKLVPHEFVSGPALNEAFAAGQIDIAYVGPGPAINAASRGVPLQIVAGAANAGAVLVARKDAGVSSPADLAGKRVGVPALGNTQDISLRHLLGRHQLKPNSQGGNVTIVPVNPADVAAAFATRQLDAALVPEPWGALLETRGAKLIGNHKSIWRGGDYPTALLVVNTRFAQQNPNTLKAFLRGHVAAVKYLNDQPAAAQQAIARQLRELTGEKVDAAVLRRALGRTQVSAHFSLDALRDYGRLNRDAGYTRTLPDWEKLVNLNTLNSLRGAP